MRVPYEPHFALRRERRVEGMGDPLGFSATFRNTRSKSGLGRSASTSRAVSMKRFDCAGSSGDGLGLRGMGSSVAADHVRLIEFPAIVEYWPLTTKGCASTCCNSSWRGSGWYVDRGCRRLVRLERRGAPFGEISRRIGQALTLGTNKRAVGAGQIVNAERDPVVMPEVEFGCIAMKVLLTDVKIAAIDAALEDRKEVLDRVGMPECGPHIFLGGVVDGAVAGELAADRGINRRVVGHEVSGLVDMRGNDRLQALCGHVLHVEAAHPTVALDQRQHRRLRRNDILPVARLAADKGFVDFNNLICAAEWTAIKQVQFGHRFADTMPEEPRGLKAATESALELAGADPLLRRTEQIDGLEPYAHRDVAGLEDGPDLDGKWPPAAVALIQADPIGFPPQPPDMLLGCATVRANRTVGPKPRLSESVGGFFVMEMSGGKDGLHGLSP